MPYGEHADHRIVNSSNKSDLNVFSFQFRSEFFIGGENKETIWGASYEESTEKHTITSEQLSRQQQSLRLDHTKNETICAEENMECSSIIASVSSSSMAITSTVCRNRTIHGHVSIDGAEKENVIYPSVSKVRIDEKPSAANEVMNISTAGPLKAKPKIKLFESVRQKKSSASETLHQLKDMSLEMSSNASNRKTASTANRILLDDAGHSPSQPFPLNQMNETNMKNTDMSVVFAPSRGSVICKSPRKHPSNRSNTNRTVNFGNDTMDVTQGARSDKNLQESRYPLTEMDQSFVDVPPKPAAVTNPYLKMFLGETINNSVIDREPTVHPSDNRNVTAHDTLPIEISMAMDQPTHTELLERPDAVKHLTTRETTAPINARNETICDQFSIDKSFDFALPNPVTQMHDKENIFMLSPTPEFVDRKTFSAHNTSDAAERVSLSETVNTTVFNFHRNNIVNSTYCSNDSNLDMTLRPPGDLTNLILNASVAPISPEKPIAMPQLPSRPTIYCDQSILNETPMSDHDNEPIEITIPVTTPQVAPVSNQRRVTCFKTESIDESMAFDNVVQVNEHIGIFVSPKVAPLPINATVHDGRMSISTTPTVSIEHHRNTAGRKTTVFNNEPISAETSLNTMPGSALNSYHYLSMEQTDIASRDTSAILPSSTLSASPMMPPHFSIDTSRPLDDFVQLTFIGDEDIEDENMELVETIDSVDGDDDKFVDQKMDVAQSRLQISPKMPTLLTRSSTSAFETRMGNSQMSLASPMRQSIDEQHAFKKSSLLQNTGTTMHIESIGATSPVASKSINRCNQNRTVREPETILAIEGNHDDTNINESSSYLQNVTADKQVNDIKVDFSGYEKFRGLATPNDVCNAFFQRCEIFKQRMHQMRESARSKNIPDPQSQNVEAPSLKFLFFNKLAMLE